MAKMTLDDIIAESGPIEPRLAALASEVDLPDAAVGWCTLRLAETAPTLRDMLARAAAGASLSADEARLLLRGVFILGGGRDTATFPILLQFLRRPEEVLERLLGEEGLDFGLPKILSGTFDGDAEALLALAADPACTEAVRCSAMEAAAFLAFDGRIARDRMRTLLCDFSKSRLAKGDLVWVVWSSAVARLAFRDLGPLVEAAFADGRISKAIMRKRHFDKELATAEANPIDASPFANASYIEDVLEALDWTRTGGDPEFGGSPSGPLTAMATDAPIELHLAVLGTEQRLPETSLIACVSRFEEAAPTFRALLGRAAGGGRPLSDDESLRLFRGLFVLAAARDTTACASLLRLLRRPTEETEALLGDAITASLPRLLISLFDGDVEPLLEVVADRTLDEFLRGSTLEAAIYLAWEGRVDRERLAAFLVQFHETRAAEEGAYVWYSWMEAVALLDLRDLVPRVEAAWKAAWIDHSILEWDDFKMDLARARTAYDDAGRFALARLGYADDIVAELEWTRHWGDEDAAGTADAWEPQSPEMPAINVFKNIGRNDPCPCGSGKKHKKCCLAS